MAITNTADERCQELLDEAEAMAQKFKTAFLTFASCHQVYSTRVPLSDEYIKTLGKGLLKSLIVVLLELPHTAGENIEGFMAYYRSTLPGSTITPKLHMLEALLERMESGIWVVRGAGGREHSCLFQPAWTDICQHPQRSGTVTPDHCLAPP